MPLLALDILRALNPSPRRLVREAELPCSLCNHWAVQRAWEGGLLEKGREKGGRPERTATQSFLSRKDLKLTQG